MYAWTDAQKTPYNWPHSNIESVYEFLNIDINKLDDGGFHSIKLYWFEKYWNIQIRSFALGFRHQKVLGTSRYR